MPTIVPELIKLVSEESARRTAATSTQDEILDAAGGPRAEAGRRDDRADRQWRAAAGGYTAPDRRQRRWIDSPLTIANTGTRRSQAVVTVGGIPIEPCRPAANGFTIERTYYKLDGTEANVTEVPQNERYVVVLKVTRQNRWPSRAADHRPVAGRLRDRQPGPGLQRPVDELLLAGQTDAAHLEFRDDRFVAAFNRTTASAANITLAYVVRAVTPGIYAHPAATVEDMYRPRILRPHRLRHGRGDAGTAMSG